MSKNGRDDRAPKLKRKAYGKELRRLQAEFCILQEWVKQKRLRVIIVFEGRDGAGKGGTVRAITERVRPRVFRHVASLAPSDREKTQMYIQRYMNHFPAAGEVVIVLTGAGITVPAANTSLGFCSREQHRRFLDLCPVFERYVVDAGIILIKYWLEVGNEEQERRFEARIEDPLRQWKLSPIDLPSREKWYEYSHARDLMLESTDTTHAPWHLVRSDDKKWARLNCITHLLTQIPHKKLPQGKAKLSKRSNKHKLDDQATLKGRTFIPEKYKSEGGLSEVQPLKRGRQRCVSPSAPITRDFN